MSSGPDEMSAVRPARLPTAAEIRQALEDVHDAHIPVSLSRMGMVRAVDVAENGAVRVALCIPCMGCPGVSLMKDQVRDRLLQIDGVTSVEIDEGMHLAWSRDLVDEDVRNLARVNGLQI